MAQLLREYLTPELGFTTVKLSTILKGRSSGGKNLYEMYTMTLVHEVGEGRHTSAEKGTQKNVSLKTLKNGKRYQHHATDCVNICKNYLYKKLSKLLCGILTVF